MLHTIKNSPIDFNLLYLENGENLVNSIKCYFLNNNTMNLYILNNIKLKNLFSLYFF